MKRLLLFAAVACFALFTVSATQAKPPGGNNSANAMNMGIDDNRQPWIRVGTDLIKPLPNNEYRAARGPTVLP